MISQLRRCLASLALLAMGALVALAQIPPAAAITPQPALSPDASQIAFVAGSAIWTVPASGRHRAPAHSSASTEFRPLCLPDGKWLAFDFTRSSNGLPPPSRLAQIAAKPAVKAPTGTQP